MAIDHGRPYMRPPLVLVVRMEDRISERVAALHRLLVETEDDQRRAAAHLDLGRIALDRRRVDLAVRHFREALLLEPDLEAASAALRALGENVVAARPAHKGPVQRVAGRLRRWMGGE
jgi:hypothetical protein